MYNAYISNQFKLRKVNMDNGKKKNFFKKHKILTAILALVLIGIVAGAGSSKKSTTPTSSSSDSSSDTSQAASVAKIGEAARDGKFEFTVTAFTCGKTSVGTNPYLTKEAQGQFCLLDVTVKNIGTEAQTFDSSSQYLFDASGSKLSADGSASLYANPEGSTFLNQINPGNTVNGTVVFDVAKEVTPVSAELHDSAFSGGVKVNLQ